MLPCLVCAGNAAFPAPRGRAGREPPSPRPPPPDTPPAPSGPRRAREKASERLRAGSAVDECLFLVPKVCGRFLAPLPRPQRISVTSAPAGPVLAALLVFAGWDEGKKPNPCANRSESIPLAAPCGEGAGCPACSPSQMSPGAGVVPRVPAPSPSRPRSAGLASRALLRGHRSQGRALLRVLCRRSSALGRSEGHEVMPGVPSRGVSSSLSSPPGFGSPVW